MISANGAEYTMETMRRVSRIIVYDEKIIDPNAMHFTDTFGKFMNDGGGAIPSDDLIDTWDSFVRSDAFVLVMLRFVDFLPVTTYPLQRDGLLVNENTIPV